MAEDIENKGNVGDENITMAFQNEAQKATSSCLRNESEAESEEEETVEHEEKDDTILRMIKVTGIPSNISEDTLTFFFENRRKSGGGDIEKIDYNKKVGTAIITFEYSEDANRVLQKLPLYLGGISIHVEHFVPDDDHAHIDDTTIPSCTIKVRGMTDSTSNDTIELYFESKRAAGACVDIENCVVDDKDGERVIYITYPCEEDMRRVLQRQHTVNETELEVTEYIPSHSLRSCSLEEEEDMTKGINSSNKGVEHVFEVETENVPYISHGEEGPTVVKNEDSSVFEYFGIEGCCRSLMLIVNARKTETGGEDKVEIHAGKIKSAVIHPVKVQYLMKYGQPFLQHFEFDIKVEKVIQGSDLQLICLVNGKECAKTVFSEIVRHLESEEKKLYVNKLSLEMYISRRSLEQLMQLAVLKVKECMGKVDIFHDEKEDELIIVGMPDSVRNFCKNVMEKQGQYFQEYIAAKKHILRSKLHAEAMLKLGCEGYIRNWLPNITMCIDPESETVIITANDRDVKKCSFLIEKFLYGLKTRRFQVQDEIKSLLENEDTKQYIEKKLFAENIQCCWAVDGSLVKIHCKQSQVAVKAASVVRNSVTSKTFLTENSLQQIITHPSMSSFMEANANKLLMKDSVGKLKVVARQDVMMDVIGKLKKLEVEGISIRPEITGAELEKIPLSTTISDANEEQFHEQSTGSENDHSFIHSTVPLRYEQETQKEDPERSQTFHFSVKDFEMKILRTFDFKSTWKSKYPTKDICFSDEENIILKTDNAIECESMVTEFLHSLCTFEKNVSKDCYEFLVGSVVQEYVNNVLREKTCHCAWFVDENCITVYGKSDDDVTDGARIISQCVKEQTYQDQSIFHALQEKAQFKTLSSIFEGKARMTISADKIVLCVTDDIATKAIKKVAIWIAEAKSSIRPGISIHCKKVILKVDLIGSDGYILDSESKTLKPDEFTQGVKQDPDYGPRIQYILQYNDFVLPKNINCRPNTKLTGPILRMNWTLIADSTDETADTFLRKILENISERCSQVSVQRLPLAGIEFVKSFPSLVSDVLSDFESLLDTMGIFHDEEKHVLLFVSKSENKENIALQINETMKNAEVYREYPFETSEQGQCVEYFDFSEQLKEMQNVHMNVTRQCVRFRGRACDLDVCFEKLKIFLQQIFTSNTSKLSDVICEVLCLDGTKQYIDEELNRKKIRCIWSLDQKEKLVKMFCDRKYHLEKGIKILTMCVEEKKVDIKIYKQLINHANFADVLRKGEGKLVIKDNHDPVEIAATDEVMNNLQEIGVVEILDDKVETSVPETKATDEVMNNFQEIGDVEILDDKVGTSVFKTKAGNAESEDTIKAKRSTSSEERQLVEENVPIKQVLALEELHDAVPVGEKDVFGTMDHNYPAKENAKHRTGLFLERTKQEEVRSTIKAMQQVEEVLSEGNHNFTTSCTTSSSDVWSCNFVTKDGLVVKVYLGNILYLDVDCIGNAANGNLDHGGGISMAISRAAGHEFDKESRDYIRKHGSLNVGECCTTSAGDLKYKGVIHTVGPRWFDYPNDKHRCLNDLTRAVRAVMIECDLQGFTKVAIPCISSGIFGVPKDLCAVQYYKAVTEYSSHDWNRSSSLTEVHFVDKDQDMVELVAKTFSECYQKDHKMKCSIDFGGDKRIGSKNRLSKTFSSTPTKLGLGEDKVIGSKALRSSKLYRSTPRKLERSHSGDPELSVQPKERLAAQHATHTSEKCSICLDDITDPKKLKCGHIFCKDCIYTQFQYRPICPTCGAVYG